MRVRVDAGECTFVAVCRCGWRGLALSHELALRAARVHELRAHPGEHHASDSLAKYRTRHAVIG